MRMNKELRDRIGIEVSLEEALEEYGIRLWGTTTYNDWVVYDMEHEGATTVVL